ncbi:MAG TPA: alpha/beta hydrolase-fold protein, partial [Rhodothermales bacterium]|nr:alpha/beta hydrolase-fold protein [Rhodothermales bacterium]
MTDAPARTAALDRLWNDLRTKGQVPFAVGDTVVWLFRGTASQVAWAGDATGWQPSATGVRLAGTDLWWRRERQAADARLDYKVVLNGNDWRLDPANPLQQWSGFGPNSELRMPAYRYPAETIRSAGVPAGRLGDPQVMTSTALGYPVRYRVYTPAGYDTLARRLPVLYVTDGHEYAPDGLGALVTVLDNLIATRQVAPLVAVFVDPRDVNNASVNRRQSELVPPGGSRGVCNPCRADRFLGFLTDELIPAVDAAYRTQ